jgi:hypothetical protein
MPDSDSLSDILQDVKRVFTSMRSEVLMISYENNQIDKYYQLKLTLNHLAHYLFERGRGVIVLVHNGLDWDAEIVLRSYYECAVKIIYICMTKGDDQARAVTEFWEDLSEISDKKTAHRAEYAKNVFPDEDLADRDIFELLQKHAEEREGTAEKSKSERRRLEQKWSFTELVSAISNLGEGEKKIPEAKALLHIYGMASHLCHADSMAMDLMTDRTIREPDELKLLQDSHVSRMMSDILSLGAICGVLIAENVGASRENIDKIINDKENILAKGRVISNMFKDSQRDFYNESLRSEKI